MEERVVISNRFKMLTYVLMGVGVVSFALGFIFDSERTWANYLLNNYYFVSLAVGAAFFGAIQYITQSGWSAMFKRVPEAMVAYLPFAAVFFLIMFFGMHSLFEWTHQDVVQHDHMLQQKSPYLNETFFFIRVVVFFGVWILMSTLLRKLSLKEDEVGGMDYFVKSEFYSKIFIFIIAFSFSLFAVDMLMSLEPHWFSTLFASRSFIAGFMHANSIIALIVIILSRQGYFKQLRFHALYFYGKYRLGLFQFC